MLFRSDTEAATAVLQPLPFASGVVVMLVLSSIWLVTTDPVLGVAAVVVFPVLLTLNMFYQRRVGFDAFAVESDNVKKALDRGDRPFG